MTKDERKTLEKIDRSLLSAWREFASDNEWESAMEHLRWARSKLAVMLKGKP